MARRKIKQAAALLIRDEVPVSGRFWNLSSRDNLERSPSRSRLEQNSECLGFVLVLVSQTSTSRFTSSLSNVEVSEVSNKLQSCTQRVHAFTQSLRFSRCRLVKFIYFQVPSLLRINFMTSPFMQPREQACVRNVKIVIRIRVLTFQQPKGIRVYDFEYCVCNLPQSSLASSSDGPCQQQLTQQHRHLQTL